MIQWRVCSKNIAIFFGSNWQPYAGTDADLQLIQNKVFASLLLDGSSGRQLPLCPLTETSAQTRRTLLLPLDGRVSGCLGSGRLFIDLRHELPAAARNQHPAL